MNDLIEFLRARLDEDERVARAAVERGMSVWEAHEQGRVAMVSLPDGDALIYDEGSPNDDQARHIARWDPARVLAEVQAKRRIVDEVAPEMETIEWVRDQEFAASSDPTEYQSRKLLGLLATSYADHPDYDPAWMVEAVAP